MATSKIPLIKTWYDLDSMDDIVALLTKIPTSAVVPIHCSNSLGSTLVNDNVQLQGQACNINGSYIDMLLTGVSLAYIYVMRVNSSKQITVKRRGTMNTY